MEFVDNTTCLGNARGGTRRIRFRENSLGAPLYSPAHGHAGDFPSGVAGTSHSLGIRGIKPRWYRRLIQRLCSLYSSRRMMPLYCHFLIVFRIALSFSVV